jgi:hypothetical protein
MEPVKMRPGTATKREYRRMAVGEEGEELDEAEWLHRAEAQSERRRRGQRYAFGCALFASLNAILLGYGQSSMLRHPASSTCFLLFCNLHGQRIEFFFLFGASPGTIGRDGMRQFWGD